jgi:hypothetical protein
VRRLRRTKGGSGERKVEEQAHQPEDRAVDHAEPRAGFLLAMAEPEPAAELDARNHQTDDEQRGQ